MPLFFGTHSIAMEFLGGCNGSRTNIIRVVGGMPDQVTATGQILSCLSWHSAKLVRTISDGWKAECRGSGQG